MVRKSKSKAKQDVGQLGEQMAAVRLSPSNNGSKQRVTLYPPKPKRTSPPPGDVVRLISNLFKLSIKQEKPIYRYGVTVELIPKQEEGDTKEGEKQKEPGKIRKDVSRSVVDKAISKWISETQPKDFMRGVKYSYLFDANASAVFALFDMFTKVSGNSQEFFVDFTSDTIKQGELCKRTDSFRVVIHRGTILHVQDLFKFCDGTGASNIGAVQEVIRAINVIVRGAMFTRTINIMTATCIFPFTKSRQFQVSPGVIANRGYFLSARPAECGVVFNVANTTAAFYDQISLLDLLKDRFAVRDFGRTLENYVLDDLKRELLNKQVEAHHVNYGSKERPHFRKYRINDIAGSSLDVFTLANKQTKVVKEISIKDYFLKEYKINLKWPKLPCIIDKGRKIPLEVCHLVEKQRVLRRMNPEETAEMIKKCVMRPENHFKMIEESVKDIQAQSQSLTDFGLQFNPSPIEVDGRELRPISLVGSRNMVIQPSNGQYDTRRSMFFKPAVLKKWALAFIVDYRLNQEFQRMNGHSGSKFSQLYCNEGRGKGINAPPVEEKFINTIPVDDGAGKLKATLKRYFDHLNENKVDHAIFVLPDKCPDWTYRYLQYLETFSNKDRKPGESWTRISCLKYDNYKKKVILDKFGGKMFLSNLWLKYNTKLGGINFVLKDDGSNEFLKSGYLFVSVDVCHPAPGDKLSQSVAAVVGMWDLANANISYCTRLRVQRKMRPNNSTIEEVGELGLMFGEVLQAYKAKKKILPTKVMLIRDGVSEGQFEMVLQVELTQVKVVLEREYAASKIAPPLLSCMVVQKRHKVRFHRKVPVTTPKGSDFNIQPGTVVDSTVTSPNDFSFYLAPHKAIQGTARAAHINMIYDEICFSQDAAQAMVHALSYLSPRCNKSTSIPTPVNLADLAAERGKNIVISWSDDNSHKMSEEERLKKINNFLSNLGDANYKNTLYYI